MGLKIAAIVMGVIAFGMLGLTMLARLSKTPAPLIAVLCTTKREEKNAVDVELSNMGLQPGVDFTTAIFPCTSPNTPRQAVTVAAGSGAAYLLLLDSSPEAEAATTAIPTVVVANGDYDGAIKKVGKMLLDRKSKAATQR